ncbi:Pentatricopeptide repeat-containing protein [Apostasia shenzhenica]|uniref:Pentatricopeptide repeat-containing protein n=1 Tax=Apostasia shenzhenica TaxID=1088818 RepID=A0A2H9ZUV4_9ASPA|nr:Pentatricopeptide repeat-containing protein [Apostasia shenzhenica]
MLLSASPNSLDSSSSSVLLDLKKCKSVKDLRQLHAFAIKTGQIHEPLMAPEVLRCAGLSDDRELDYALKVFDQMAKPNIFSWNTIIRAFSESDEDHQQALRLFVEMLHREQNGPNCHTYPSILKACATISAIEEGKQIHCHSIKLGFNTEEFVLTNLTRLYAMCGSMEDATRLVQKSFLSHENEANAVLHNILIDGYCRHKLISKATKVFDEMTCKSVISWNGMISRYTEAGLFKEAVIVFYKMQDENVRPNFVTLVSVLPAISRLGALELGKWVHVFAEKNEIEVDDVLGSALVDMYAKCGSIESALQLFDNLPKRSPVTWSALIGGLAIHGRARDAINYFVTMKQDGIMPTSVVFLCILNACSHGGLVEEGRVHFNEMIGIYGLKPKIEHYGCMVDMLSRAGYLQEAEELIKKMPMKPDDVIYKALLSACRIHGNSEIGLRWANHLLDLAPGGGDCCVLLSNFYASMGDWKAVAEMRLRMKKLDARKNPGCSWIEAGGEIHEFVMEDNSHPQSSEISLMLVEMARKLKEEGYVPDTKGVLLNVDEQEKENIVLYHSEKIATAFGLIGTEPGTTIRVVKNLRICKDCHDWLKLASKIYERRIIVRDRSRFHHFESGFCSCKDYW